MTAGREHVFATTFGVAVHDDERCWCNDTRSPETDWYLEVLAAAERNRLAQGTASPTPPHPTEKDSR